MKPLIITHKNCTDGCCSKAIFQTKFGENASYLELDHANLDSKKDSNAQKYIEFILSHKNSEVYIADFCLKPEMLNQLLINNNKVVVLDHHETSIPYIEPFEKRIQNGENLNIHINFSKDNTKSGSLLSWNYLYPDIEPPMSIRHVSAGDIWKFEFGESTRYFYTGLMELFKEPQNIPQHYWEKLIKDPKYCQEVIDIGEPLRESYMQEVYSYIPMAERIVLNGVSGLMVNAPKKYTSDLGNVLAKELNGEGFGLVYYIHEETQTVRCSLRSIAPLSVKDIAQSLGGGGHAQASAFSTSSFEDFQKIVYGNTKKLKL